MSLKQQQRYLLSVHNVQMKADLVFEAGAEAMRMLQGSYSCICLVHGVGTVAFRDPFGIR